MRRLRRRLGSRRDLVWRVALLQRGRPRAASTWPLVERGGARSCAERGPTTGGTQPGSLRRCSRDESAWPRLTARCGRAGIDLGAEPALRRSRRRGADARRAAGRAARLRRSKPSGSAALELRRVHRYRTAVGARGVLLADSRARAASAIDRRRCVSSLRRAHDARHVARSTYADARRSPRPRPALSAGGRRR